MKFKLVILVFAVGLMPSFGLGVKAQSECTAVVRDAIAILGQTCVATGRNQVCHGYFRVEVKAQYGQPAIPFAVGDVANLDAVRSITTYPINPLNDEWGVALMQVQANLPSTLPGQNVTFLLMGDTNVTENFDAPRFTPMQAIRLETGVTGVACEGVPTNGLLIQTPRGTQEVKLLVNGVEITMAGTAFVEAVAGENMTVTTVAGDVAVTVGGSTQTIAPNAQVTIPMSPDLAPSGVPSFPVATGTDFSILIPPEMTTDVVAQDASVAGSPIAVATVVVQSTPVADAGISNVTTSASASVAGESSTPSSLSDGWSGLLQLLSQNATLVALVILSLLLILVIVYALLRALIERLQDGI